MNHLLSYIALVLFVICHFANAVVIVVKNIRARAFFRTTGQIAFTSALDLDIYGNYAYRELWNAILINRHGYKFGRKGETISSALGRNQIKNDLTFIGWLLVYILWAIDVKYWRKGGHCLNSIMTKNEILQWAQPKKITIENEL